MLSRHFTLSVFLSAMACSAEPPSDPADDTSDSVRDTAAVRSPHQAVFVVHLEPGPVPRDPETGLPHTLRAETYFKDLLDLELHRYADDVSEIVDQSAKEAKIEKKLGQIRTTWTSMNMEFDCCVLLQSLKVTFVTRSCSEDLLP